MNRDMLLDLFDAVDDRFVLEAVESRRGVAKRFPNRRVLLIAAAIAAAILLVGCAAVYLWMNDLPVVPDIIKRYDVQTDSWVYIEGDRNMVFSTGTTDGPVARAAAEWYTYTKTYEVDFDQIPDTGHPDVPADLQHAYNCYTPEMMEKLYEIMDKYKLQPLGEIVYYEREQDDVILEALGIDSLVREDSGATINMLSGYLFAPCNFKFDYNLTVVAGEAQEKNRYNVTETYRHKDYMHSLGSGALELEIFDQWNYTNADGVQLLMALAPGNRGIVITEQKEGYLAATVNSLAVNYQTAVLDRAAMERLADAMNFKFTPKAVDPVAVQPLLDAAHDAHLRENGAVTDSLEDYVKKQYAAQMLRERDWEYALVDLTGDGNLDMLLGFEKTQPLIDAGIDKRYDDVLCVREDGSVRDAGLSPTYFCENGAGIAEYHLGNRYDWQIFHYDKTEGMYKQYTTITRIGETWYQTFGMKNEEWLAKQPTITEEEARAILNQYVHILTDSLDWRPLGEFPLSDGSTLEEYLLTKEVPVSNENLPELYAEELRSKAEFISHFRIVDLNEDGIDDILLSHDGNYFDSIYTYRYGYTEWIDLVAYNGGVNLYNILLYDNNILGMDRAIHQEPDIEIGVQSYYAVDKDWKLTLVDYVGYNRTADVWLADEEGTEMTKEEAEAILANYPRDDQQMQSIEALVG